VKAEIWFLTSVALCAATLVSARSDAQGVPGTISFSARLQADGAPSNATHDLVFKIFDAAEGGTPVWTETAADTEVHDGVVSRLLGATAPMTPAIFDGGARWLEISVDGTVLQPRLAIASVPYAMRADVASRVEGKPGASGSILESFTVNARSDCGTVAPTPRMAIYVNREQVGPEIEVVPASYAAYEVRLPAKTYASEIAVAFVNDSMEGSCDHNLHVESIVLPDGTVLRADSGENVVYDKDDPFDGVDVAAATTSLDVPGALRFFLGPQVTRTASATYVKGFIDWRNNNGSCAVDTWCDVPQRTVTIKKQAARSLLKITYTDTLGSLAGDYAACNWRIVVGDKSAVVFSDADLTRPGGAVWTMNHASHVGVATDVGRGTHVVKVESKRSPRGTECLMGWNEHSGEPGATGSLLVEEIP
jgi:hypothetical protein